MIKFLDCLAFLIELGYASVFFRLLCGFIPVRKSWLLRIPAFICCAILSAVIVYSNDLPSLVGPLLGFAVYITIFHRGKWTEKLTAVIAFYPALIAINYLTEDMGRRLFFACTDASGSSSMGWSHEIWVISTAIHVATLVIRFLFWLCTWFVLRKYLGQITSNLTIRMWLILDMLALASFVAIFTIIYFLPESIAVVYPICAAAIFSSFGCIYFVAYIRNSIQTAYRAQELETKQAYFQDRLKEEERVRSIYHDMKNHLLILQARTESLNRTDQIRQEQTVFSQNQAASTQEQTVFPQNQAAPTQTQTAFSQGQTASTQEQTVFSQNQAASTQEQTVFPQNQATPTQTQIAFSHEQIASTQTQTAFSQGQAVSTQAQMASTQEISRSIQSLQEQIEAYENYIHTGNDYLDVILRDKSRLAREKQIDFHAAIQFAEAGFVEPLDISTIWGNALDNAIEASEKLPESMRLITAKASRIHDLLVITIENNRKLEGLASERTDKEDTFLHGFGIANIQRAAEKYGGQCVARPQEEKFVLKVADSSLA